MFEVEHGGRSADHPRVWAGQNTGRWEVSAALGMLGVQMEFELRARIMDTGVSVEAQN